MPLNTRFKSDEAAYVVRSAGARVLLTVRDFLGEDFAAIAEAWDDVPSLERVVDMGDDKAWTTWLTEGDAVAPAEVEGREPGWTAAPSPTSSSPRARPARPREPC